MIAKIKEKPFLLLLFFASLFMVCFFIPTEKTIDIQLHDSYWVFRENDIFVVGCILFYFLFGLYLLFQKILFSRKLIWMHILATISFTMVLFFSIKTINYFTQPIPRRYHSYYEIESFAKYAWINNVVSFCAITLFFSQFLFIINFIVGLIKKPKKSQQSP